MKAQRAPTGVHVRPDTPRGRERQIYVPPRLVEYGSVAKLTQTGGMTTVDFLFNLRRMGR